MCKDNVTFDKAIEALNLNYKDAVANERDIPNLDIERKNIVTSDFLVSMAISINSSYYVKYVVTAVLIYSILKLFNRIFNVISNTLEF